MSKTLKLKKSVHVDKTCIEKPEINTRPTLADLERKAVEDSRKYIEAKREEFRKIREASGFTD